MDKLVLCGKSAQSAAAWRLEDRNHNWNTILTSPRSAGEVVAAKFFSIMVLIALMQAVFIALALGIGRGLGIQGEISPLNLSAVFLAIIPAFAVGAWQSFFSMILFVIAAWIASVAWLRTHAVEA